MTISKLIPVLCALGVGAIGFAAQAEDNPAQAAARMALAKQLFEVNGTNAPAANTAPETGKDAKGKAKADKAAAAAKARQDAEQAKADQAAAAAKAKQDAAQAKADMKARQEAEKKMAAQQAAEAKAAAAAGSQASQKPEADRAAQTAAMAERMNAEAQAKNTAPATNSATKTKATGADQASKAKKEKKEKPVAAAPKNGPVAGSAYEGQDLGMKQISAPALPISSSKAERLQSLLDKYKADQITPDEYHQQRAAILAEP